MLACRLALSPTHIVCPHQIVITLHVPAPVPAVGAYLYARSLPDGHPGRLVLPIVHLSAGATVVQFAMTATLFRFILWWHLALVLLFGVYPAGVLAWLVQTSLLQLFSRVAASGTLLAYIETLVGAGHSAGGNVFSCCALCLLFLATLKCRFPSLEKELSCPFINCCRLLSRPGRCLTCKAGSFDSLRSFWWVWAVCLGADVRAGHVGASSREAQCSRQALPKQQELCYPHRLQASLWQPLRRGTRCTAHAAC